MDSAKERDLRGARRLGASLREHVVATQRNDAEDRIARERHQVADAEPGIILAEEPVGTAVEDAAPAPSPASALSASFDYMAERLALDRVRMVDLRELRGRSRVRRLNREPSRRRDHEPCHVNLVDARYRGRLP